MTLIVGLGNPGTEYIKTRHNIGFLVVDKFLEETGKNSSFIKFNSELIKTSYSGKELLLLKPLTYMNNSGYPVLQTSREYGIELAEIIVIHDDLDIEFGKIKLKRGGGTGGHNGLDSIAKSLGSNDFNRLRFGLGRPPGKKDPADFVLSNFRKLELKHLDVLISEAGSALKDYLDFGIDFAMNKYNNGKN